MEQLDCKKPPKNKKQLHVQLIPHTKINLKWILNLNIRIKIIKILDKNIGDLSDPGYGKDVLNRLF